MKSIFSPTNFINIFGINLRDSPFLEIRDLNIINIVIFFIYNIRGTTSPGVDRRVGKDNYNIQLEWEEHFGPSLKVYGKKHPFPGLLINYDDDSYVDVDVDDSDDDDLDPN